MKKKFIRLILLLLPLTTLTALTLTEVSAVRINLGQETSAIGLVESETEHWKPLFFDVDIEGNIHIPDFYKARIAVYKPDGKFKTAIPCGEGISPRLNYFGLSPSGNYITFGDSTLYMINSKGKLLWKYNFGYGIIPSRIIPADSALFLILPSFLDQDGRAIVFDYSSPMPLGRYGKENNSQPFFRYKGDHEFTPLLKDMSKIDTYKNKYHSIINPSFITSDEQGTSLWSKKQDKIETLLLYTSTGEELAAGSITFPEGFSGTGFWTISIENSIYKNYFFKDYILITKYSFK